MQKIKNIFKRASIVVSAFVMTLGLSVWAMPVSAAINGKRVAVLSPFTAGVKTGTDSPNDHGNAGTGYGFAWDLHGGAATDVYPRVTTGDGAVTMKIVEVGPGNNGAGTYVGVEVKVAGTVVGKVRYSHLINVEVSNGQENITTSTKLGTTANDAFVDDPDIPGSEPNQCKGFKCSTTWDVHTTGGIHTHVSFMKACYGPQAANTNHSASTGLGLLSENYGNTNKSACDGTELVAVAGAGSPATGVGAMSSQYTAADNTQHIYWSKGKKLYETWVQPGVMNSWEIVTSDHDITAISSQYTAADGAQHVYWGNTAGEIFESWFSPNGSGTWRVAQLGSRVNALSSHYTASDNTQHIYSAAQDGKIRESWFRPGTVNTWEIASSGSAATAISSQYTNSDSTQHVYWGTASGGIYESWFRVGAAGNWQAANIGTTVKSLSSLITPDGTTHIYSGGQDGKLRETWFYPGTVNTWEMATSSQAVTAVSNQYTSADNTQHVLWGDAGGEVYETWTRPGVVNTWAAATSSTAVSALTSQYTSSNNTQHIFWGGTDGHTYETWFYPGTVNTWQMN